MDFSLYFPCETIFGEGTINTVGEKVKAYGRKCVVVTGKSSSQKSGALSKTISSLTKQNIEYVVFNDTKGEPDTNIVDIVRELSKKVKAEFIIGLGGGSVLDIAKASAGLFGQKLSTLEYLNKTPFNYKGIPFIGIPTTAGTGSEITLNSVLYNSKSGNKNSIADTGFQAKLALIDPELTYSMTPYITACTGMDALVHAIESYTSKIANQITMALAEKSIELIGRSLVNAVNNNMDKKARNDMAMGSMIAALAFSQTGVGVAHAISHPLGAIFHIPHGIANAILIPTVIDFNYEACPDKYDKIACLLGDNKKASNQIRDFLQNMPLPKNLADAGYTKGQEEEIIIKTFGSRSLKKNAKKVTEQDVIEIIMRS